MGFKVEPEGFEPSSKRAIIMLSTCLFSIWFFVGLPVGNYQRTP